MTFQCNDQSMLDDWLTVGPASRLVSATEARPFQTRLLGAEVSLLRSGGRPVARVDGQDVMVLEAYSYLWVCPSGKPRSGIPFIHIDTGRVPSWTRLPRYELALLFPEGRSKHMPATGGPISKSDVNVAKSKHFELSLQIAQFWKDRFSRKAATAVASADPAPAKSFTVASLTGTAPASSALKAAQNANAPQLEWRATPQAPGRETEKVVQLPKQVASLTPTAMPVQKPKLVTEPKIVDRPSRFTPNPSTGDRSKLAALAQKAGDMPMPKLVAGPAPAVRPQKALAAVALKDEPAASSVPAQKGPLLAALMPGEDGQQHHRHGS